jgi:predicted ATPase
MRIAVSGTHCCGKSTLIAEFLSAHPDFAHEPEPYVVLVEDYGEEFSAEPCAEDFYRQLQFNVERLSRYQHGDKVIFERSPIDFLAYLMVLNSDVVDEAERIARKAILDLDLIMFLPLDSKDVSDDEYPRLRRAVDERLEEIFADWDCTSVLESKGSTAERLQMIENAMNRI